MVRSDDYSTFRVFKIQSSARLCIRLQHEKGIFLHVHCTIFVFCFFFCFYINVWQTHRKCERKLMYVCEWAERACTRGGNLFYLLPFIVPWVCVCLFRMLENWRMTCRWWPRSVLQMGRRDGWVTDNVELKTAVAIYYSYMCAHIHDFMSCRVVSYRIACVRLIEYYPSGKAKWNFLLGSKK